MCAGVVLWIMTTGEAALPATVTLDWAVDVFRTMESDPIPTARTRQPRMTSSNNVGNTELNDVIKTEESANGVISSVELRVVQT